MLDTTAFLNGSLTYGDGLALLLELLKPGSLDRIGDVQAYEQAVERTLQVKQAFALGAGRMGLYLLLKAWGLGNGDEVILPGYTCVVMPNAIRFARCKPVYVDIRLSDFNLDPTLLEAAITPRTRAVVMQHSFGIPGDIQAISEICERRGLYLIEDAAHALGAKYAGRYVGNWGQATVFSTETSKMISTDKGGLLTTNDVVLGEKLKGMQAQLSTRAEEVEYLALFRLLFRLAESHFLLRRLVFRFIRYQMKSKVQHKPESILRYDSVEYQAELDGQQFTPYPYRLSGILSLAGRRQIERLHQDVAQRRLKANLLRGLLPGLGAVTPLYDERLCEPSWVRFPFLVEEPQRWREALAKVGLPAADWLNDPLHPRETRSHQLNGYAWGSCPNAEYAAKHILNLPVGRAAPLSALQRLAQMKL